MEELDIPKAEVDQLVKEIGQRYASDIEIFGGISLWSAAYYALMKIKTLEAERDRLRTAAKKLIALDCHADLLCAHWDGKPCDCGYLDLKAALLPPAGGA